MKTYRVEITVKAGFIYEVEAENKADAIEEAKGAAEAGNTPEEFVCEEVFDGGKAERVVS